MRIRRKPELTRDEIASIVAIASLRYADGAAYPHVYIAALLGVTRQTVTKICVAHGLRRREHRRVLSAVPPREGTHPARGIAR